MPTLIAWGLRAAAAALAVRWIVKERRRVNEELYGSGGAEAAAAACRACRRRSRRSRRPRPRR